MTYNVKYFVILQANEVGSSNAMELEGAKRSFNFLKDLVLRWTSLLVTDIKELQSG